ncbi:hypothetical protein [Undibacterium sp.]|uniref:hypothetical protein n=1 Tax=Undibacterium sp. TaxID=1914977 RepID=UPI002B762568|nr:hypothetical protein [Undibacterium sp.]HTD04192.1 hypothetical protein [Undibacterium sp.]
MRGYAKISPKFWISGTGEKLRDEGWQAQMVALYLMSSPQANMTGLYYLPKPFMLAETGLTAANLAAGLQGCIRAGFCQYDEKSRMVWVHEMARFQVGATLKPRDKRAIGVQTEYDSLPDNPFLQAFYDKYAKAFCMSSCRGIAAVEEGNGKGLATTLHTPSKVRKSQEQEQEQDKSQNLANTDVLAVASDAGDVSGKLADSGHREALLPPAAPKSAGIPSGGGKPAAAQGSAADTGTAGLSLSDGARSTAREQQQPRAVPAATACPHQEIIALYHELLPQCPRVRDWTHGRARQLRSRWNEDPSRQNLAYWRTFFEYVAGCAFLTGKSQLPGKRPFIADLEWMTKAINFTKIREQQYENY